MKMRKVGISMPENMFQDLTKLSNVSGVSRSQIVVDFLDPVLSDLLVVVDELEEVAAATGGDLSQVAFGPRALKLFKERMEQADVDVRQLGVL